MSLRKTLASSKFAQFLAQNTPLMDGVADRFVPAINAEEAVEIAQSLQDQGFLVCAHHLGPVHTQQEEIKQNATQILEVMELLDEEKLNLCVSLTPSELGYHRSTKAGDGVFKQIARNYKSRLQAHEVEYRHGVQFQDKEGPQPHLLILHASQRFETQKLLAHYTAFVRAGISTVLTIPAAHFRSQDDVKTLISQGGKARLSLIPQQNSETRYYTDEEDIRKNYLKLARLLLSEDALIQRVYSIFALEDEETAERIKEKADQEGWPRRAFEFEIPYGSNDELAEQLLIEGYNVRILLPFGREWWPYYVKMSQSAKD